MILYQVFRYKKIQNQFIEGCFNVSLRRFWLLPFCLSNKIDLLTVPRRYFFCGSFVLLMSCVCYAFASVYCCLVVTCWERADLLALVCDFVFLSLSLVVSWVRHGTWFYRFLIFVAFLTLIALREWLVHSSNEICKTSQFLPCIYLTTVLYISTLLQ